jgi:hypothetical protein
MADIPKLRSREQIIGDIVDSILARVPELNDLNQTSVLRQFIEAVAQSQFKAYADIINMIDANSIDRAIGDALQRKARDANVPILQALPAISKVNINDKSFEKISSFVYSGQPAPVAGSLTIYIVDGSKFNPTGGKIYIGRNTPNFEGPLDYISVTPEAGGAYYKITLAPTSPTTKFHNIGESVVLAQGGNRLIPAGTQLQTAQGASLAPITFSTTANATIPDGETTVENIPVVCEQVGTIGNVPKGAIKVAIGLPFPADVTNPIPASFGREADTDEDIRNRIKAYEQAKAKGTELAIKVAAIDVMASDENKKVQSANISRYTDGTTALVFDDGTGYEAKFVGAPFETIIDKAVGGEKEIQLRNFPLAQARLKCVNVGPYNLSQIAYLSVEINNETTTHQFNPSDFKVASSALPFEVIASINANPNINFLAATADNGTRIVLFPKDRFANSIKIKVPTLGYDANEIFGFPQNTETTLKLYVNDKPLLQDGKVAKVTTLSKALWSNTITSGDTLKYKVDGTPEITVTFTNADFQVFDSGAVVSSTQSLELWSKVFEFKMSGVKANINGDVIEFTSTRGASNQASIEITGGTLVPKIFAANAVLFSQGITADYTLNKQTGQLALTKPLSPNDKLTAGTPFTRANILTESIPSGISTNGRVWMIVDGDVKPVPNGLKTNTQVKFTKTGTKLTITANSPSLIPEGFEEAKEGDWVLVWADPTDPAPLISNQGYWKIESVQQGQIIVDDGNTTRSNLNITFTPLTDRIQIVRSNAPIQLWDFNAGSLTYLVNDIQSKILGIDADIVGSKMRITTQTYDEYGELYIIAADKGAAALQLPIGQLFKNVSSHFGFQLTADTEASFPSFTHSSFGTAISDSVFNVPDYLAIGGNESDWIEILDKYTTSPLKILKDSNKERRVFVKEFNPTTNELTLLPPRYMKAGASVIQANDRYFLRSSFQFDPRDIVSIIVDSDTTTKNFNVPISRKLKVNTHSAPTNQDFSADDAESSLALNDPASFNGFDFNNFKVLRQARTTLTNGTYSIQFKSYDFGKNGEKYRVGFVYPDDINQTTLSHRFNVSDIIDLQLILPVTNSRTPNWDHTTSFTTQVTTTQGKDTVTFTYRVGTQPDFSNTGANVQVGDIVIISNGANFLPNNKNIRGKVVAVTPTSFTIEIPTGTAISDNISFSDMINQNGTITITTPTPHNIINGQLIGIWNTSSPDGLVYPFNTIYVANVISPTQFSVQMPSSVPHGNILTATHSSNIITINTSTPHNLQAENIILISGVGIGSYDGLAPVYKVITPTQFQIIKNGVSAPISNIGRFDYQSFGPSTVSNISTITKTGNLVTVVTTTNHNLSAGNIIKIANVTLNAWNNATTYNPGDLVRYNGQNYISLTINTNSQPDINPTDWSVTTLDLGGMFIVDSVINSTTFTYYYQESGNASGTGGTTTLYKPQGSLARSLANTANLAFGSVQTTAQEVVDYVTNNLNDKFIAKITNGNTSAPITQSTEDEGLSTNYLSGNILGYQTFISKRLIKLISDTNVPIGSTIYVNGFTGSNSVYNGYYVVLENEINAPNYLLTVYSSKLASQTSNVVASATFTGSTPYRKLYDGANSIKITNLGSLIGSPQFTLKKPFNDSLEVDEKLYLLALNSDQIVRFWNRLVVTGLSNVSRITNSQYGRQIQITTNTFGNAGSIQVAGGTANKLNLAVVGSAFEKQNKMGIIKVPYELRKGLVEGQWLKVQNQLRQNKQLGFDATTSLQVYSDGIGINGGSGTFQTIRPTTQDATTQIKVERQGDFVAIISIGGSSFNLSTAQVQEGDWVRIKNVKEPDWQSTVTYSIGARVHFNGLNYTSLINGNLNNQPDISPTAWEVQEFNQANQGIYQVVRVFGEDTFYIKSDNAVEEIFTLGNGNSIKFYSYDSVMPNDTLVISTNILGTQNVGRYKVVDESFGTGYFFPTATRIWTTPIPNPPALPVTLGAEYTQVNIEEKDPLVVYKRIFALGAADNVTQTIIVDSPNLVNRISSSVGSFIEAFGKFNFDTQIHFGVDAYKYYTGLTRELNRVIYGDASDIINYPGVRAAGTTIDIKPAIIKRIKLSLVVRLKTGLPFSEIRERVKASVAGYINSLGVGENVSLSKCIAAANSIPGVIAVAITYPQFDAANDLITVSPDERPLVLDPTTDITVSVSTS